MVSEEMVKTMNKDAIIFAMANPTPEIMPDLAKKAGARVVGTGLLIFLTRLINNVVAFPGIFKGALERSCKTDYRRNETLPCTRNCFFSS